MESAASGAFRTVREVAGDRSDWYDRPMFDTTLRFDFAEPEGRWLKSEVASLGRGIELWRVTTSGHEITVDEPNKITYVQPLMGRVETTVCDTEFDATSTGGLLFSPSTRMTRLSRHRDSHSSALAVLVSGKQLDFALNKAGSRRPDIAVSMPSEGSMGAGLRTYLRFLAQDLDRARPIVAQTHMRDHVAAILEEYVIDLLVEQDGRYRNARIAQSAGASYAVRAEELMRARLTESITMADIADELGVGLRSLQAAFSRHRGQSPRRVLTTMRLEEARRRLARATDTQSVTTIALDCGFIHFGRFSQAYKQAFGELPSETLKSVRT